MNILSKISKFFSSLFKQSIQQQLDILIPIAREIVIEIENDPTILVSKDKQAIAVSKLLSELAVKEIAYIPRLLNLAIEIAVVDFKGIK